MQVDQLLPRFALLLCSFVQSACVSCPLRLQWALFTPAQAKRTLSFPPQADDRLRAHRQATAA